MCFFSESDVPADEPDAIVQDADATSAEVEEEEDSATPSQFIVSSSNNLDSGIISTCQEPLPDASSTSPVALQRIAVEYQLVLTNPEATEQDALALLDPIAERLHAALLKDFLTCQYNDAAPAGAGGDDAGAAQFHALYSAPPDVLKLDPDTGNLASCSNDADTSSSTLPCFVASAQFSMEVFYKSLHSQLRFRSLQGDGDEEAEIEQLEQQEQMQVATSLTDSALVTRLGTYLVELFNSGALLDDGNGDDGNGEQQQQVLTSSVVASLQFNGFENVALDGSAGGPETDATLGDTRGAAGTTSAGGGGDADAKMSAITGDYQEPRGNEPQVVLSSLAVIAAIVALILVAFLAIRRRRRQRVMDREEEAAAAVQKKRSYYNQRLALEREMAQEEYDLHAMQQHYDDEDNIVAKALERDCEDIQNILQDSTTIVVMSDTKSSPNRKNIHDVTDVEDDDEPEEDGFEVDPRWRPDDNTAPRFVPTPPRSKNKRSVF
jgi:hypothetical protein